ALLLNGEPLLEQLSGPLVVVLGERDEAEHGEDATDVPEIAALARRAEALLEREAGLSVFVAGAQNLAERAQVHTLRPPVPRRSGDSDALLDQTQREVVVLPSEGDQPEDAERHRCPRRGGGGAVYGQALLETSLRRFVVADDVGKSA